VRETGGGRKSCDGVERSREMMRTASLWLMVLSGCEAVAMTATEPETGFEQFASAVGEVAPGTRGKVLIVEIGAFPDDLKAEVERALKAELQVEVEHLDAIALPKAAWYAPRKRYRADKLLDILDELHGGAPATTRVLGLTAVDISTTKEPFEDWGIFGLGNMPGQAAVVSSYRLKRKAKDRDHVKFRVSSTAVHEVGHTFGLPHCTEKHCVMQDAEGGITNTDEGTGTLGESCRQAIDEAFPVAPPK
jgi:archaemetzincin